MPIIWPANLQQRLNVGSFSESIGNTVLRTEMDIGPAKVRRRFTRSIDTIDCSINVTRAEYDTFMFFFKTTVNGGATQFEYTHPISEDPIMVRFTGPPKISPLGAIEFIISMQWEIMP